MSLQKTSPRIWSAHAALTGPEGARTTCYYYYYYFYYYYYYY